MKIKNIVTVLLVVFMLASCAPAANVGPAETSVPASTLTPIPSIPTTTPIPSVNLDGQIIPDPRFSNPELFDVSNPDSPIAKFVNAFIKKSNGEAENDFQTRRQELADEVLSGLKSTHFTIQDRQYVVFTTQDILSTSDIDENNIPLVIAEKGNDGQWAWSGTSMKQMFGLNGLKVGSTISGDEPYQNPAYNNLLLREFSIINSGGTSPLSVSRDGYEFEVQYSEFAKQNGLAFRPGHLFDWGEENHPGDLDTASKSQIVDWMNGWVNQEVNTHPFFDSLNFANEPVGIYDGSQYWVSEENPWYRAYQEQWPVEAYNMIYTQLDARGLKPGEDVHLILNLPYGVKEWGYDPQFTVDFMSQMKNQIQNKVGPNAVMDVGIQFHMRDVPIEQAVWGGPHVNDLDATTLTKFFEDLGKTGPVHITEMSVKSVKDPTTAMRGVNLVLTAAIQSGTVKDVVFWEALKSNDFLFNAQFENNIDYYLLLQTLLSNLEK